MSTSYFTQRAPSPAQIPPSCPNCGIGFEPTASQPHDEHHTHDAQRRILELENQVRILTGKATAAVDKLADYEDQLHKLKGTPVPPAPPSPGPAPPPYTTAEAASVSPSASPLVPPSAPALARTTTPTFPSRITNLLSPRLNTPSPPPATIDLQAALSREQKLRVAAEGQLNAASTELEELSTQLFMQANEMVASERKARAKLEARVEVLERRDNEKRARLERLENAVRRVERVRGLLAN